jgi:alpha-L-arabinofuranosidase
LRQTSDEHAARVIAGKPQWRDYTLNVKARKISGREGFLIMFDAEERGKNWWNLGGWGNREHGLEVGGVEAPHVPGKIETGRWYDIRIELAGNCIRCFLDGKLIHDVERQSKLSSLYAVAGKKNNTGEIILKVVNAASESQETQIQMIGNVRLRPQARVITMSHADSEAENSVEAPMKVVPVETKLDNVKPEFTCNFPANSITVIRMRTQ